MRRTRNERKRWTATEIGSMAGQIAIVTGTGGLGYETALALASAEAEVVLAGRSEHKGKAALERIKEACPSAKVRFMHLDLAALASVKAFCERAQAELERVDLLINNAGIMATPVREVTKDGFELQLGTNYLGHFALTMGLLPLLGKSGTARVVNVSSMAHRSGHIHFDDLQLEKGYTPLGAYSQSKLACLMFAFELQRRSAAAGWGITSIGVHPGGAATGLFHGMPRHVRFLLWLTAPLMQTPSQGAQSALFAASSPVAKGGCFYGPTHLFEARGKPELCRPAKQAMDEQDAAKLWTISCALLNIKE
ncbi:MAG: oxidoreductase [Sporolactobacillus sp.]